MQYILVSEEWNIILIAFFIDVYKRNIYIKKYMYYLSMALIFIIKL